MKLKGSVIIFGMYLLNLILTVYICLGGLTLTMITYLPIVVVVLA